MIKSPAKMVSVIAAAGLALVAATTVQANDGQAVYNSACFACHTTGVAGAPKIGDKANWAPRIAQGIDLLYKHSLEGYQGKAGYMPPKGGFAHLSDAHVKLAVDYMVKSAQ
jgi:cytochrome c5